MAVWDAKTAPGGWADAAGGHPRGGPDRFGGGTVTATPIRAVARPSSGRDDGGGCDTYGDDPQYRYQSAVAARMVSTSASVLNVVPP
jgi:hypothetical protein